MTNAANIVYSAVYPLTLSDHYPVVGVQKKPREIVTEEQFLGRSYKNYVKEDLIESLVYSNWRTFYDEKDPNKQWASLLDIVKCYLDKTCPIKMIKITGANKSWLTTEIKELIMERRRLSEEYLRTHNYAYHQEANDVKNIITKMSKDAKKDEIQTAFEDAQGGHKSFWETINRLINPQDRSIRAEFVRHDTKEKVPANQAAEYFNNFFAKIGDNMAEQLQFNPDDTPNVAYNVTTPDIEMKITYKEVEELVKSINISKSSGIEGVNAKVLKDVLTVMVSQLQAIFQNSVDQGIFPKEWATSTVIPIPKSGTLSDIGNWRPINLLPVPGRLLEKLVHKHIMHHLEVNDLLTKAQFGFRPGLWTADAIFEFLKYIFEKLEMDEKVTVCFVDDKKAFDSVSHITLLRKCKALGLNENVVKWLSSYLADRKQCTLLNNVKSSQARVSYGVPQGSSLGPLLFLIVINDLPRHIRLCRPFVYADDLVLVSSHRDFQTSQEQLQADMTNTYDWSSKNCITINKKKTKTMSITRHRSHYKPPPLIIKINDVTLEEVNNYQYLGVCIDNNLNFKQHVSNTIRGMGHKVSLLGRIRKFLEEEQSLILYKQMIIPYPDYASFVIDCSSSDLTIKLQRIQNLALRICKFQDMFRRTSVTELHNDYNIQYLADRRFKQLLQLMYKQAATYGANVDEAQRRTRNDIKVKLPATNYVYASTSKSPWYRGVWEWDGLTHTIQRAKDKEAFKSMIKGCRPRTLLV